MLIRRLFAALHLTGLEIALGIHVAPGQISAGLVRVLAGLEKGMNYYLQNHVLWGKMGLLVGILALEAWPMVTLAALLLGMVLTATAMARGIGVVPRS